MDISYELISIFIVVAVSILFSFISVILWFCRCRKDHVEDVEDNDFEIQMKHFEAAKSKTDETKRKNEEKTEEEKGKGKESESKYSENEETIGQYEDRINNQSKINQLKNGPLQRVKDDEYRNEAKNKKLDTISEIGLSNDSLQRNDSKNNVYISHNQPIIEVDLNPGLSSSISLEKI